MAYGDAKSLSLLQQLTQGGPPLVMMYIHWPLSLRQVEDLLFGRGFDICHETVRFWWNRFGPLFAVKSVLSETGSHFDMLFNRLGRCPALSVPSVIGGNGLPTSVQIVARHSDDERVFRIGKALEQAQPWLDCGERRPLQ